MRAWEWIAERRIEEAMARGAFDCPSWVGKPLPLDQDAAVPAEQRLAWRILRNAGFVPEEVQLRRDLADLLARAAQAGARERPALERQVEALRLRIGLLRPRPVVLDVVDPVL
jgi:hypothetical protein